MSERAISLTKQADGTYQAERDGRRITVPVLQRTGDDAIDRLRAEYEANEALGDREVKRLPASINPKGVGDTIPAPNSGPEDPVDRARVDQEEAETYTALVRWKVASYNEMVRTVGRNAPKELTDKRNYWVSEQQRLGRADASNGR